MTGEDYNTYMDRLRMEDKILDTYWIEYGDAVGRNAERKKRREIRLHGPQETARERYLREREERREIEEAEDVADEEEEQKSISPHFFIAQEDDEDQRACVGGADVLAMLFIWSSVHPHFRAWLVHEIGQLRSPYRVYPVTSCAPLAEHYRIP